LNLTIDGSIGVEKSIEAIPCKITTADFLLPAEKTQGESRFQQQKQADKPGFMA